MKTTLNRWITRSAISLLFAVLLSPVNTGAQALPAGMDPPQPTAPPALLRIPDLQADPHAGHDHAAEAAEEADPHAGHDHAAEAAEEAMVTLVDAIRKDMGIEVSEAGPMVLRQHLVLPGEVQVNGDRLAHIVPRFPGLVTEVRKHMGDQVKRGEVLAVVESNESLSSYELTSMIAGTVIDKHITIGETIRDDTVVYTVADLATVWVDLTVFQRDLATVRTGQRVTVMSDSGTASGTLEYISPTLHPETRTALARVMLDNSRGQWKPGMFVTGRLALETHDVPVVVPDDAVQMLDGEPVVFVPTGEGFSAVPVRTGRRGIGHVEILEGLHSGDAFVTRGAFHLKAEIITSGLDPHAGHGH